MPLTPPEVDAFLAKPHTVVVATLKRDGSAQLSTTWYRWDGWSFWIATNRDRAKFKNLHRDDRISVLVDDPPAEASVTGYGRAVFAAFGADAYEGALAIVRRYVDDPEGYMGDRESDQRVLIRLTPERIVSWKRDDERR